MAKVGAALAQPWLTQRFAPVLSAANGSFIRNIYFDYWDDMNVGLLKSFGTVTFSKGGKPENLPGGKDKAVKFESDANWTANAPGKTYGVNMAHLANGSMRVGVQLQGLVQRRERQPN